VHTKGARGGRLRFCWRLATRPRAGWGRPRCCVFSSRSGGKGACQYCAYLEKRPIFSCQELRLWLASPVAGSFSQRNRGALKQRGNVLLLIWLIFVIFLISLISLISLI